MWLYLETGSLGVIKVKWDRNGGPNPIGLVFLKEAEETPGAQNKKAR